MALRTPLYEHHKAFGARFVEFAGWEHPVQFKGILSEHRAVREDVGIFDVSHMGWVRVQGPGAQVTLERLFTNLVGDKEPGQAIYGCFCNEQGGILDDLMVYKEGDDSFFVVVNAATREKDVAWMQAHARDCTMRLEERCILAVQGPRAPQVTQALLGVSTDELYHMHFQKIEHKNEELYLARTGYTGSDGFEWMVSPKLAESLYHQAVERFQAQPCGLGARDTLRLEAGYRLYGTDMDEEVTPHEAGLGFAVKLSKDFVGSDALRSKLKGGLSRKLSGFVGEERAIPRHGAKVFSASEACGQVTSATFSPTLKKVIGLAMLPVPQPEDGFAVEIRGRLRPIAVAKPPFVPISTYRPSRQKK